MWTKLAKGGQVLMPLQAYPFSKWYGWIQDKYGLSWQLILTDPQGKKRPFIIPSLLFVKEKAGQAESAINLYLDVFKKSKMGTISRYPAGMEPNKEGTIQFADFMLENHWFVAMDSARKHDFSFNEAISFMVNCRDQAEIDYYWHKLSADKEAEQCGWLKDKFGVSWQIVPDNINQIMFKANRKQLDRLTQTFLKMKKLNIKSLENTLKEKNK